MSRKKELADQALLHHGALQTAIKQAEFLHSGITKLLDAGLSQTLSKVEADYRSAVQRGDADLARVRQDAAATLQKAMQAAGIGVVKWSAPEWNNPVVRAKGSPPSHIRLGEFRAAQFTAPLPAMLPLVGYRNLLLSYEPNQSRAGADLLQSLIWRLVTQTPPGTYELVLLDPLDRGAGLASVLKLPEAVRGPKIYCQDAEIEAALVQLLGDIEEVTQKRLLNTYTDIEAYNRANPQVAVPYRFLVVAGFPKGFTAKAVELLSDIARTGRRAGCYALVGALRGAAVPYGPDLSSLTKSSTLVTFRDASRCEWNDPDLAQIVITPDPVPPATLVDRLAAGIAPLVVASRSTVVPFQNIAVRKANWWRASSLDGLVASIGLDESGKVYQFEIGRGVIHHALVGGATGTGKTNLLHLLILQLCTSYSPDELQLYLIDFKKGVEFKDYVQRSLPHARAVVIEAEREFGLSILNHLEQEMERRSQLFKAASANDLGQYRKQTGKPMPRILLLMDEYVVLFSEDDRLSTQASNALGSLVMRGRSFGVHVLLAAQRPKSSFLDMAEIKSQMGLRMALKCRPDDSTLILGEGNERAARLTQAGEACVTSDPDNIDATARIRTARVTPDDLKLYLGGLREFAALAKFQRPDPMIVFARDEPTYWAKSPAVAGRLSAPTWQPAKNLTFWLGQPLRIADDPRLSLAAEPMENLLIVGVDSELASRMLIAAVLGLAITTPPSRLRFLFAGAIEPQRPSGGAWQVLTTCSQAHRFGVLPPNNSVDEMNALATELDRRLTELPNQDTQAIALIVPALHQWGDARAKNAYTPSPVGEALFRVIQQGSQVGIHCLMATDRLATLGSVSGTGSATEPLSQFRHRVATQMSQDESMTLLDVGHAGKLGPDRAYYHDQRAAADMLEKIKPYAPPSPAEITGWLGLMHDRWTK